MGITTKVCSLVIWCCFFQVEYVYSQGYWYKSQNVNQYQVVNGKYELITTTTPPPTMFETLFPWMGDAYDSSKTPEEDAAILNSISDPILSSISDLGLDTSDSNPVPAVSDSEGLFSWLPSMPSLSSLPSLPGFGSSETTEASTNPAPMKGPPPPLNGMGYPPPPPGGPGPNQFPPQGMNFPPPPQGMSFPAPQGLMEGPPPNPMEQYPPGPMGGPPPPNMGPMNMYDTYDTNAITFPGGMMGSASQNEPVAVPPPGGHMQMSQNPMQPQYSPMPPANAIPYEIRNNMAPTFQFHQNVKDSIPIPSPSIGSSIGHGPPPPMYPYAYSASFQYGTKGATNERPLSQSFIDTISSYFNIGKRSDLDLTKLPELNNKVKMEARSDMLEGMFLPTGGQSTIDLRDWASFVEKAGEESEEEGDAEDSDSDDDNTKDGDDDASSSPSTTKTSPDTQGNKSANVKDFPCPKSGIWRWNGEVCIAVGPIPVWACKPNDLTVSGKIAICRNKIYFSPKVINKNLNLHAA